MIEPGGDVEIIHTNRNPHAGIKIRGDRLADDEVAVIGGAPVKTPQRKALGLACWYPL